MNVRSRNKLAFAGRETGPTVMLTHGFGCDQKLWRLVVERLHADFHADDILDIAAELDLTDVGSCRAATVPSDTFPSWAPPR